MMNMRKIQILDIIEVDGKLGIVSFNKRQFLGAYFGDKFVPMAKIKKAVLVGSLKDDYMVSVCDGDQIVSNSYVPGKELIARIGDIRHVMPERIIIKIFRYTHEVSAAQ